MYTPEKYLENKRKLRELLHIGELDRWGYTEAVGAEDARLMQYCKEAFSADYMRHFHEIVAMDKVAPE